MSTLFYLMRSGDTVPLAYVDAASQAEADSHLAGRATEEPGRFGDCRAVTYEEWLAGRQREYLAEPAKAVDEEAFDYAMNCLPPRYCRIPGADLAFFVTEAITDGVYRQFARFNGHCVSKCALPGDRSTYLSIDDLPAGA